MSAPDPAFGLLSFRKQNLLVEFASLQQACPDGVYVTITPGDPTLWAGVVFVRGGPYAPAVLRFQLAFPPTYPDLPPLITFSTDIFHPLITPLTTYTYTTGALDSETVSATDEERLPPGGFSLRHGFPQWFGRARRRHAGSRNASGSLAGSVVGSPLLSEKRESLGRDAESDSPIPSTPASASQSPQPLAPAADVPAAQVLEYLRTAFSDESVLDSIPLEAAANPGAYHAWRAHRGEPGRPEQLQSAQSPSSDQRSDYGGATSPRAGRRSITPTAGRSRRPGEWNWDGVWEERVKKGVQASLSDPVLFGGVGGGDDMIRFLDVDAETLERVRSRLKI